MSLRTSFPLGTCSAARFPSLLSYLCAGGLVRCGEFVGAVLLPCLLAGGASFAFGTEDAVGFFFASASETFGLAALFASRVASGIAVVLIFESDSSW